MANRLVTWWKKDTSYHTFVYTNFIVGFAFTPFATYAAYQLQATGFLIGTDENGLPCTTYCIVPWGGRRLDLNAILLYMNALTFALSGVVTIFLVAYADFWNHTLTAFNAIFGLFIIFGIVGSILMVLLNIYIPYCMRNATPTARYEVDASRSPTNRRSKHIPNVEHATTNVDAERQYGFGMSIWGMLNNNMAATLILVVTIILSATLPAASAQSSGLLISTVVGFITVFAAIPCFLGLPQLPTKPYPATHKWYTALVQVFLPFRELAKKPDMLLMLLAYTVYTDTYFATGSILSQLYYVEIQPSTLEFSLYSLATYIFFVVCTVSFYAAYRRWKLSLEKCLLLGYAITLIVPVWGCIGIAEQDGFGDKHRWEFYVQLLITNISSALVNPTFRLLYAEQIPAGEEVMWFGMQVVLSCATTWITYVATGPLQNAKHDLRFPLILCLIFFAMAVVLEGVRFWFIGKKKKANVDAEHSGEVPVEELDVKAPK